jgi:hypothetical protein
MKTSEELKSGFAFRAGFLCGVATTLILVAVAFVVALIQK